MYWCSANTHVPGPDFITSADSHEIIYPGAGLVLVTIFSGCDILAI